MEKMPESIGTDLQILGGKPCIRGTRISVDFLVEMVTNGATVDNILSTYPHLKKEDVEAALKHAGCAPREVEVIVEQRRSSFGRR